MDRPSNPFVITKKTVFMQRISDATSKGAVRYIQGTVPVLKAGFFAAKMKERYEYDLSYQQASRQRKLGYATVKLYFWHSARGNKDLHWILLATNGKFKNDVGQDEKWRDPTHKQERIAVTNYVLVRNPTTFDSKPRWTWKYSRASYDAFRHNIVDSIRSKDDEKLKQTVHTLFRSPSFSGVRDQVKRVVQLITDEWKRTRSPTEMSPEIPKTLGYVRRLEDKGVRLHAIKVQLEKIQIFSKDHLEDMEGFYD